jgi:hypothetical protein
MADRFKYWEYVRKYDPKTKEKIETNLIYTPLTNKDKTKLCMLFDHTSYYQNEMLSSWLPKRPFYTKEMVKFFFDREVKYLDIVKDYPWCPTVYEINIEEQYIIVDWAEKTCNTIIYENENLSSYCTDWQQQLESIIKQLDELGYYKVTLYPHCFFVKNNVLKTFDFYGMIEKSNPYINIEDIKGLMGEASMNRFIESTEDGKINLEVLTKKAMEKYIYWPDQALNIIYQKLF